MQGENQPSKWRDFIIRRPSAEARGLQQALQIREKSKVSTDIAETLQGLGDTLARVGQFDQALTNYLKALDLRRNANDVRGAALVSAGMSAVFNARGRYGASLLFVRWTPAGDAPAGHVESGALAWGRTPVEAEERLKAFSLST